MKKQDLVAAIEIALIIALFLIPTLINTGAFANQPILLAIWIVVLPILAAVGIYVANFIGKKIAILWQFAKFVLVGFSNTAIDFGVLNTLILFTGITGGLKIVPLNATSFTLAVINSFFWNKRWVFKGGKDANFITFFMVTLIGLGINSSIVYFLTTYVDPIGVTSRNLWVNVAKALATGVSLFWNFAGYKLIVFKR